MFGAESMLESNDIQVTTWRWWASRRMRYNRGLIIAGVLAFVCYVTVVFAFASRIPDAEITIFTTVFQGIGYLVMMGIANVIYFIGPISEKVLKPRNPNSYRRIAFGLGYWFSIALPFMIPVFLLILVVTQPSWWTGNVAM